MLKSPGAIRRYGEYRPVSRQRRRGPPDLGKVIAPGWPNYTLVPREIGGRGIAAWQRIGRGEQFQDRAARSYVGSEIRLKNPGMG
jgi:hypothetical protein